MLEKMVETPETVFFKYAYPCSSELARRKTISPAQKDLLDYFLEHNKAPERELLEVCFPNAIKRLKRFADGRDYWSVDNIREYFFVHHNMIIDNKEESYSDKHSTPQMRDLCKVKFGKISDIENINGNIVYIVKYATFEERVSGRYLPDAKVNDKISIHWRFAIEKI